MWSEVQHAKSSLIAAMSFFLFLDTIVVALRVYVRAFAIRAFGWDDATLCLSYVCTSIHLPCSSTCASTADSNAFVKVGYILACTMGFTAIYYGYAYDGPPREWPHYDERKAQQVSQHLGKGALDLDADNWRGQ